MTEIKDGYLDYITNKEKQTVTIKCPDCGTLIAHWINCCSVDMRVGEVLVCCGKRKINKNFIFIE